jgi:DNA-binding transcriptional LysR family regulator
MSGPKISLEQWRALVAVVEAGGYAQAAEALHKTQSTVTYAVQKLESLLGVAVFQLQGRKAQLTPTGQVLYRRGRALLDEAARVERAAASLAQGWEPELRLAVEVVFPTWLLLKCFDRFAQERPDTRVELYETVLGGTDEAVLDGRVDLAIASRMPPGFLLDPLVTIKFVCAAAPHHPLHRLGRGLTLDDLRQHRQLVIRDSGSQRKRGGAWLGAEQRWTVSAKATSIRAATMGLGFAWYAENIIREELDSGALKPLPLVEGAQREVDLYLIVTHGDAAGPGAQRLAQMIREGVAELCPSGDERG